ncbi:MAG: hypothetical protein LM587_02080 [Candidatus Aenigmarchaeota archaeon]|nr:hypothetical protein [Candidatus Aenigmarchaeota archaeon]
MKARIVTKFGGSSLTFEKRPKVIEELIEKPEKFVRFKEIERYAKEISKALAKRKMRLFIFHGVKQYGHIAVEVFGISPKVRKYCEFLSDIFVEIFRKYLPVEQVDLAKFCKWNEKLKIFEFMDYLREIKRISETGCIPVSFGTVVDKTPKGYAIISGDDALLYTGLMLKVKEAIMYVDVPICNKNPKKYKNAKPVKVLHSYEEISIDVEDFDKTGGLIGKLKKLEILALNGSKCQIVNALKKGNVYKSLLGKKVGTLIIPKL